MCSVTFIIQLVLGEYLSGNEKSIKVSGVFINNIQYADDTVLIADNLDDLQQIVKIVGDYSSNQGLNIKTEKTHFMIVTR